MERYYLKGNLEALFLIREIVRPKYAHPTQEEKGVMTAELPLFVREGIGRQMTAAVVVQNSARKNDHNRLFQRKDLRISA